VAVQAPTIATALTQREIGKEKAEAQALSLTPLTIEAAKGKTSI